MRGKGGREETGGTERQNEKTVAGGSEAKGRRDASRVQRIRVSEIDCVFIVEEQMEHTARERKRCRFVL